MAKKLCPKILLEGTRLTGKTELAFALNEHPRIVGPRRYRYHSPLISAEWCAFTNFPWGRGLINYLPGEETQALETYRTWLRLFELQRYYSWIIDRFHLSTLNYQIRQHGRAPALDWLDEGLARLNFRLVLLVRQPESFAAAREERIKVSGNPGQYDELSPFIEEQESFRKLARSSRIPFLELDVTGRDTRDLAGSIADWLEESGGLYMPDAEEEAPLP
jgi:hypothetical protein